ncbi:MAG: CotH kinase family protein, partial [Myxococcota bacterium]
MVGFVYWATAMTHEHLLRTTWIVAAAMLVACGSSTVAEPSDPPLQPRYPDPPVDRSAVVFEQDRILEVAIDIDPDDWDELREQTRSFSDVFGTNCLDAPPPRPFTYFPAQVTIDGELIEDVGARKKGFFGSLDTEKPSLKISFNEYRLGQRFAGMRRLTLNNSKQDPSYVKQCVGYDLFRKAGVPASRCNFAHVTVNGNDLGLYVHVEGIKKEMLRRYFPDTDGNMYEAALSDFRPDWINTWERKTNEHPDGPQFDDRSGLEAIVTALAADDAGLVAALAPLINLDDFYTFWAMEVLIAHL